MWPSHYLQFYVSIRLFYVTRLHGCLWVVLMWGAHRRWRIEKVKCKMSSIKVKEDKIRRKQKVNGSGINFWMSAVGYLVGELRTLSFTTASRAALVPLWILSMGTGSGSVKLTALFPYTALVLERVVASLQKFEGSMFDSHCCHYWRKLLELSLLSSTCFIWWSNQECPTVSLSQINHCHRLLKKHNSVHVLLTSKNVWSPIYTPYTLIVGDFTKVKVRGSRVRFPAGAGTFSFHHRVHNGSGAHPA
jgi:hypothetical protein